MSGFKFIDLNRKDTFEDVIDDLKQEFSKSEEATYRFNCHKDLESLLQHMIIISRDKKGVIHRHHDKNEVLVHVEGELEIEFLNEEKQLQRRVVLSPSNSTIHIEKSTWHRTRCLSNICIYQEITSGPFIPSMMEKHSEEPS